MKRSVIALVAVVLFAIMTVTGASATTAPPTPTNLEVTGVTETSVTLAWGPAQPGEFYGVSETKNSLTLAWGASQDSRSAVTYTLERDGSQIASGLTGTQYKLTGLHPKLNTFRTCVTAVNTSGQKSPPMCATWTR